MKSNFTTTINGTRLTIPSTLVQRYNTNLPRYTSYPTAPVWTDKFGPDDYIEALSKIPPPPPLQKRGAVSLYLHIPFCESRCLFCGCSTIATTRHEVAERYIDALGKEIELVTDIIGKKNTTVQLHLGGGSPTFLSPAQLERLWRKITRRFSFDDGAELAFEADPRVTTAEHLRTLRSFGFNRLSLGVQDLSKAVMGAIGRVSSFEDTKRLIDTARETGYKGVNLDIVYGLPHQTVTSFRETAKEIITLSPDRIACFNFAYLPKMLPHQRRLPAKALPPPGEKLAIFCMAIELLGSAGYELIGMDHFAKKNDELSVAAMNGTLRRGFQGYSVGTIPRNTSSRSVMPAGSDPELTADLELIGLGMTSISDIAGCYAQNSKKLIDYYRRVEAGQLATVKGWRLSEGDLVRRRLIRDLFCKGTSRISNLKFQISKSEIAALERDGLIKLEKDNIQVTPLGRLFIRNIAAAFDGYMGKTPAGFSKAI